MPRINPKLCGALPCLVLAAMLAGQLLPAFAEDVVPSFSKDRYESLRARSPFALATAVATPAPQASFAANWYVTSIGRVEDKYYVTIKGRDLSTQFSIFGDESVDGVSVASVNWSDTIGKTTVILRKGTETARLEFNEAQLKSAPVAAAAGASPVPGGAPRPAGAPAIPAGPRPPAGVNMAAAVPNGAGLNGGMPLRRRSLPIPVPR